MDLEDLLIAIEQWLQEAEGPDGVDGEEGTLPEPKRGYVAARLENAESHIEILRDPNQSPSLDPVDVGDVIETYDPQRTDEFASDCVKLATEARKAAGDATPDHEYIGDRIATISSLLPGYRQSAGIT